MSYTRIRSKGQRFQTVISFDGHELLVKANIIPAHKAPHVSADSPRFLQPGNPMQLVSYTLHDEEGEDVTGRYVFDDKEVSALILEEWRIDQTGERMLEERVFA
jgi:hypothetical protein